MSSHPRLWLAALGFLLAASILHGQAVKASWLAPVAAGSPASLPSRVVASALSYLGVPYVLGGVSREGVDCSGFVYRVFRDTVGASLPRGVGELYRSSPAADVPLHVGDLLFFDTTEHGPPSVATHVGIYLGGGRVAHAASEGSRTGVIVSAMADPYYRNRFIGARRVMPWRPAVLPVVLTDEGITSKEIEPFPSGAMVTIAVTNRMSGGGPVSLTLIKDGSVVLSRWITPGGGAPVEVQFVARQGTWTVRVDRIFKGRTLADVAFSVVE